MGKDLSELYNDHPFHQGPIDEETLIVMAEQENCSGYEEEHMKAKPDPDAYKPHVSYPQALKSS